MTNAEILAALPRREALKYRLRDLLRKRKEEEKKFDLLDNQINAIENTLDTARRVHEVYQNIPLEVRRAGYDPKYREFRRLDTHKWAVVYPALNTPGHFGVRVHHDEKFGFCHGGQFLGFFKAHRTAVRLAKDFLVLDVSQDEYVRKLRQDGTI